MEAVLTIMMLLYLFIWATRLLLALLYWNKNKIDAKTPEDFYQQISVIEPIVSGEPQLDEFLRKNLTTNSKVQFIFSINKTDEEAKRIVTNLINDFGSERVILVENGEPPENQNDKVIKQNSGLAHAKEIFIAVDDDTFVDLSRLGSLTNQIENEHAIFSGLPYYKTGNGFLMRLVAAFSNGNSVASYLPMAFFNKIETANGMFYIIKSETLKKLDIFNKVSPYLCDEYEIAKVLKANNVKIIQTVIPCEISTSIRDLNHYITLMKRWMVFTRVYMKENNNPLLLSLVTIPPLLLVITLFLTLFCAPSLLPLFFGFHWLKTFAHRAVRQKILDNKEPISDTFYEMLSEYLLPFHFLHSIISPRYILWRNRLIDVSNPIIHYLDPKTKKPR